MNQLDTLVLNSNTALENIVCGDNPINSLDISDNVNLSTIYIENMPTLKEVCVWALPFPPSGVSVMASGSPNVVFINNCASD